MFLRSVLLILVSSLTLLAGCENKKSEQLSNNSPSDPPDRSVINSITNDDSETLSRSLEAGVNPNLKFSDGSSLLHYAVFMGSTKCAKLLVDSGADLTLKDRNGFTVLDNARANSDSKIVTIIENRMNQLGIEIKDTFKEISAVPQVSIKSVNGDGNMLYAVNKNGGYLGRNVTLLEILEFIPTTPEWFFETENLPTGKFWVEVTKGPLTLDQNWPILKEAFEKTFDIEFVLEKRLVDIYVLKNKPDNKPDLIKSETNYAFDWDYTEKGIYLKNCEMDELCGFLGEKLESEVINETSIQGLYNLYLDYDTSVYKNNLDAIGLLLEERKAERDVYIVKKLSDGGI